MALIYRDEWALSEPVSVPNEPGESFRFRRLTGDEMDEAASVASKRALEIAAELAGFAEAFKDISASGDGAKRERDPLADYDAATLVNYGVGAWSYRHPQTGEPVPCDNDAKSMLDGPTRDWAARHIVSMMVRTQGEGESSATS